MIPNAVLASWPRSPHSVPSGVASCYIKFGPPVSAGSEQSIIEFKRCRSLFIWLSSRLKILSCLQSWRGLFGTIETD